MSKEWDEIIRQRIQQGMTDEQIAVSVPFSLTYVKGVRFRLSQSNEINCEHEYKILMDNAEIEESRYSEIDVEIRISGCAVFYCNKCLDIQKKMIK